MASFKRKKQEPGTDSVHIAGGFDAEIVVKDDQVFETTDSKKVEALRKSAAFYEISKNKKGNVQKKEKKSVTKKNDKK